MKRLSRRAVALGSASLLISGLMVATAAYSFAADPLISKGKATKTSSSESAEFAGGKAVDGNATTRWASAEGKDPQWIEIDLGASATISRVVLRWEAAYGKAYKIQTSADGTTWKDINSTTNGDGGVDDLEVSGSGRYVRMNGTARGTAYGYSLFEFEVYGSTGPADTKAPTTPANLTDTGTTATTQGLKWDASTDNVGVTKYDIYHHGQLMTSVDGKTLAHTVTGLTPNTQYFWTVIARDAAGNASEASNEVAKKTPPAADDKVPPTAPSNLTVAGTTSNSVSLTWTAATDNSGKIARYDVFSDGAKVGSSATTSATISGLTPNTTYSFTAKAYDAAGNESPASNSAVGKTKPGGGGGDTIGKVTQVTTDNDIPWGLEFLPGGAALMTERDTFNVVAIAPNGQKSVIGKVPGAATTNGEGGLLGLEVSPNFTNDNYIYVYTTTSSDNRVMRAKFTGGGLSGWETLLTGLARNKYHNGGRLRFGPDGKLYIGTGDAQNSGTAQNMNSNNGKILRINADGSIPSDNPFPGKAIWSLGHRNVQGLAFDSQGRLWEGELGNSSQDELNLIQKGKNYGWPTCEGNCNNPGMVNPVRTWGVASNSPSGLAIVNDVLYMAALRGERLYQMKITGNTTTAPKTFFQGTYGRLRTVEPSPDGGLWLTTTNGDKGGSPGGRNNKILHVELTGGGDPGPGPGPGAFTLTSTAYKNGGAIPDKYSCAGDGGAGNDISPPLAWGAGSHKPKSYALTFIDLANGGKHWAIWDIPASTTSLPEGLKKGFNVPDVSGAKQKAMGNASVNQQFFGPCPRSKHTYEFTLYAINVDTLPGLSASSTVAQIETAAQANDIASTKLSGTSSAAP
jgi:Raf kinase inhibitor-like YbhB/YbcL family protein